MTLLEMSALYAENAAAIRARIIILQQEERNAANDEIRFHLQRRIADLTPLLREARELAAVTARYYDKGFYGYDAYKL